MAGPTNLIRTLNDRAAASLLDIQAGTWLLMNRDERTQPQGGLNSQATNISNLHLICCCFSLVREFARHLCIKVQVDTGLVKRLSALCRKWRWPTHLVRSLVELLGIERAADTKREAAVDLSVVGERGNAEVVDLGLLHGLAILLLPKHPVNKNGPWQRKQGQSCTWRQPPDQRQSWTLSPS